MLVGGSLGVAFYMASLEVEEPLAEELVEAEIKNFEMEEEIERAVERLQLIDETGVSSQGGGGRVELSHDMDCWERNPGERLANS